MASMPFTLIFDQTGFPLIRLQEWSFSIALFPVSKYQFERYLSATEPEETLFTDSWYRSVLETNPRCGWKAARDEPWRLFLSGLEQDVMNRFFRHCHPAGRLPTAEEWRQFQQEEAEIMEYRDLILAKCKGAPAPVLHWLDNGLFPLTDGGMLEYVQVDGTIRSIGKPFYDFHPTLWQAASLRDIEPDSSLAALAGFRMVVE